MIEQWQRLGCAKKASFDMLCQMSDDTGITTALGISYLELVYTILSTPKETRNARRSTLSYLDLSLLPPPVLSEYDEHFQARAVRHQEGRSVFAKHRLGHR